MLSIIVFFVILSVLVLIHELGHFIVAKKHGVVVEEFGFGLPPRLFGIKKGETLYSLNLLPFGGFVKVLGEERQALQGKKLTKNLQNRTFVAKKPWQRASIIAAGVIANFLLGWVIISYLFTQGVPVPTNKVMVEKVIKNSPADVAGLKPHDSIESVLIGADRNQPTTSPLRPLRSTQDLIDITKKHGDEQIILVIQRGEEKLEKLIIPRKNPPQGEGPLGVVITSFMEKKYPWYQAPFLGLIESMKITAVMTNELLKIFFRFITFQKVAVEVAGPIGIAKITAEAVKFGNNAVLQLLGLLSLNLAVINILPFPALDGGRLTLVVYEWITKKKVNPKIERQLNLVGFIILFSLIILITVNDILKIFVK